MNPYSGGIVTKVPVVCTGALFPQSHLVNFNLNSTFTAEESIFSTPAWESLDGPVVPLGKSLRLQWKLCPDHRLVDKPDYWSDRQILVKKISVSRDRPRFNVLSSPIQEIVLEMHVFRSMSQIHDQSIVMVTDSRSEAEVESREQSARTHNRGWSLANQRYEQTIHAGANNLRDVAGQG